MSIKELIGKLDNFIMNNLIMKIRGIGILVEAVILYLFNNYILIPSFNIYKNIEVVSSIFKISSISVTDMIAAITSLLMAIGFIYYIGYKTASRIRNPSGGFGSGDSLRETITPYGAILLLAFFMPLMMIILSKLELSGIGWYITWNIILVFVLGFGNEWIVQRLLARVISREKP